MSRGLLQHVPRLNELQRLYWELAQAGAPSLGANEPWPYCPQSTEQLLALAAEMSRFDARLLGVLVQFVAEHWSDINPLRLRTTMQQMRWPQTLLVVFDFVKLVEQNAEFRRFANYVAEGWTPLDPYELYFIDGHKPHGRMAHRQLGRNLQTYARWGFIATERPSADVFHKRLLGRYSLAARVRILKQLAQEKQTFSVSEYLRAVDQTITRQQAMADFRHLPGLSKSGQGRGARWSLAKPRTRHAGEK